MSENSVSARAAAWPASRRARGAPRTWAAPSFRRWLQLALAVLWLLDAMLQLQSFMFGKGFSQMLAGMAAGNPGFIADPITWSARLVAGHPTWANAAFASVQLFLAVGIAWRPTVKVALAASIPWALGVWWAGEGLGGVLTGTANPVMGGPGAVIIYALLAVLLWPTGRDGPFEAARPFGATPDSRPGHARRPHPALRQRAGSLPGLPGQPGRVGGARIAGCRYHRIAVSRRGGPPRVQAARDDRLVIPLELAAGQRGSRLYRADVPGRHNQAGIVRAGCA